jgi:LysR substrate binding domain
MRQPGLQHLPVPRRGVGLTVGRASPADTQEYNNDRNAVRHTHLGGHMIIAGSLVRGSGAVIHGFDPSTGEKLEPAYQYGDESHAAAACEAAAFATYRSTLAEQRAKFLKVSRTTSRPSATKSSPERSPRLGSPPAASPVKSGATGQLRMFADVLREGSWNGARIDPAQPDRTPFERQAGGRGRPRNRRRRLHCRLRARRAAPVFWTTQREQLPDVKIELREMVSSAQFEGLMIGKLDLGMARPPLKRPGIVSRPLLHEQLIAAVFHSIGAFRERPVELDAAWHGDSTNPALLRLLRDVLPAREWTTDTVIDDVLR